MQPPGPPFDDMLATASNWVRHGGQGRGVRRQASSRSAGGQRRPASGIDAAIASVGRRYFPEEQAAPAVATMLRDGIEDCLAVLSFPEHHRRKFRSTNLLENMMKRLKKRTRVVGVFPNRAGCRTA